MNDHIVIVCNDDEYVITTIDQLDKPSSADVYMYDKDGCLIYDVVITSLDDEHYTYECAFDNERYTGASISFHDNNYAVKTDNVTQIGNLGLRYLFENKIISYNLVRLIKHIQKVMDYKIKQLYMANFATDPSITSGPIEFEFVNDAGTISMGNSGFISLLLTSSGYELRVGNRYIKLSNDIPELVCLNHYALSSMYQVKKNKTYAKSVMSNLSAFMASCGITITQIMTA